VQPGERFCINCGAPQPSGQTEADLDLPAAPAAAPRDAASSPPALRRATEPDTVLWRRPGGDLPCPRCGEINAPENRHCQACGFALAGAAEGGDAGGRQAAGGGPTTCGRCGYTNPAGNRFCQGCGAPLGG
jgi:hypothetical protein